MCILIFIAVAAILAHDYISFDATYPNESAVYLEVGYEGEIEITPHSLYFSRELDFYGNLHIRFLLEPDMEGVVVNLPYGWAYEIIEYEEVASDYDYDDPYGYIGSHYEDSYDYGYIGSWYEYPYDYDYPEEPSLGQRYITIMLTPPYDHDSYVGEAPGYFDMYIGYAPVVPFDGAPTPPPIPGGAGRIVTFNPNGGNAHEGHTERPTLPNGTIGAGRPYAAYRPGARFMWWSTCPEGRNDPNIPNYGAVPEYGFDWYHFIVPEEGLTLYAIWGFIASFYGNGIALPPAVGTDNPASYVGRRIIEGWSFEEAEAFGMPVVFPWVPRRPGFQFWGWYDARIPIEEIASPPTIPTGVESVNHQTPITGNIEFAARWRLHTHLVMFDMNHANANLAPGTAALPQRLYRWVLDDRSIADSGIGGTAAAGTGAAVAAHTNQLDRLVWGANGVNSPVLFYRQNIQRPWIPNYDPLDAANHRSRWNPDGTANAEFSTPYYPGSGLVRGTAAGVINANAGTQWPRSAPNVYMTNPATGNEDTWRPFPQAPAPGQPNGSSNAAYRPRYTLEGWWTIPQGCSLNWAPEGGGPATVEGRRFAPAGVAGSTYTSGDTGGTTFAVTIPDGGGSFTINTGFPTGLARNQHCVPFPIPQGPAGVGAPRPAGIVHGGDTESESGDMTVYARWVYRVTFDLNHGDGHGPQGFSIVGATNFNPGSGLLVASGPPVLNYRDIPVGLSPSESTINQSGQRVRVNDGTFGGTTFLAHQPFRAGMPPGGGGVGTGSPFRAAHIFNGWWDRPVTTTSHVHLDTCTQGCVTVYCYPLVHHNAYRITGDTQINGNLTAYAHWRYVPTPTVFVNFHLNVPPSQIATTTTENVHGMTYWPTHRPVDYLNPLGRFFLSRPALPANAPNPNYGVFGYNVAIPLPAFNEVAPRYTSGNLAAANVNYADRYSPMIRRSYGLGNNIISTAHPVNLRMPRNPRRTGYVFVGWSTNPNLPPFDANGVPTAVAGTTINHNLIFNTGTVLNAANDVPAGGTLDLYAIWAPAFDLILDRNGGTTPAGFTQFVRPMPIGFMFGATNTNGIAHSSRWGTVANGMSWIENFYIHSTMRTLFGHPDFVQIGLIDAYNTHQDALVGHGSIITATTVFNDAFFSAFPANNLVPAPGNDFLRIYVQWGGTLTFNANHNTFDPSLPATNPNRNMNLPVGHSVNMTLDPLTRHAHHPTRGDVWPATWLGTTGVDGTRGGWPREPDTPWDVNGGDWLLMFTVPNQRGWSLVGWNRMSDGSGEWVTADTTFYQNTTIFAIWGPYIIFNPGLGGAAVDMDPVRHPVTNLLNWEVVVGSMFPTPTPGPPTWPGGQNFVGWFPIPNPDPTDPEHGAEMLHLGGIVQFARRYYAVWNTLVIFDPTGPPGSTAATGNGAINTISVPGQTLPRVHFVGRYINIMPSAGEFPTRPGWPNSAFSGRWFAPVPVSVEFPQGRRFYHPNDPAGSGSRIVMQGMTVFPEWMSTITFRPGHERGRLDGLGANVNVSRTVPDGLSLMANAATQRTPTASSAVTGAAWPNDPGLNFGGWRRTNAAGQPLNANGTVFTPTPGTTWPPLWTTTDVNNMITVGPSYYFEAVWSPRIEFHKVSNVANVNQPLGYNPLAGGRFVLDRYVPGAGWQMAYPMVYVSGTGWEAANPAFVESDAAGRVLISQNFHPLLVLPQPGSWPASGTVDFRLREVRAPLGYLTPTGHWIVTISRELGVLPTYTAHQGAALNPYLAFSTVTIPSGVLQGQRQFVRNIPYEFNFWKVRHDNVNVRLPDAQFQLAVFNGEGTPILPAHGLVLPDMIGSGPTQWSIVGTTQTSSLTAPMRFRLRPGRYYHLLEIAAPSGFRMPSGQWQLTVTSASGVAPTINVTPMGGMTMPAIDRTLPNNYSIHNWLDFELPLTGGDGIHALVIASSIGFLVMISGAAFIILRRRKLKSLT